MLDRDAGAEIKSNEVKATQRLNKKIKVYFGIITKYLVECKLQTDILVVQAKTSTIK